MKKTVKNTCLFLILCPIVSGESVADQPNKNDLAVQTALTTVCSGLNLLDNPTTAQTNLLQTCTSLTENQGDGFTLNEERLAPEEAFVFSDSVVNLNGLRISSVGLRLDAVKRRDGLAGSSITTGSADGINIGEANNQRDLTVYASTRFSFSQFDSKGLQGATDNYSGAFSVGADLSLGTDLLVGGVFSFLRQDTEFYASDSDMYMNAGALSLYGTWFRKNLGYTDVILDLGYHKFNLRRKINLFNENRQYAIGKTDATVASLTVNGGRDFQWIGFDLGPYFRVSIAEGKVGGYSESAVEADTSSGSLLNVRSHSLSSKRLTLGGQIQRVFGKKKRLSVAPQFRVEVETELEDNKDTISAAFVHDSTNTEFTISGDKRDDFYMNTGLGLTLSTRAGTSAFVFAESQWKNDAVLQHWLKLGLRMGF